MHVRALSKSAGLFVGVLILGVGIAHAAPAPLPTADEIRALYDAGKDQEVLAASARVLALKDDTTAGYNRHAVRMTRADAQLRLKQYKSALDTLEAAAAVAEKTGSTEDASAARALAFLVRQSSGGKYVPTSGQDRAAIDITTVDGRQPAFGLLFDDRFQWCKAQGRDTATSGSLLPLLELAKTFSNVRDLERVASHTTQQSDELGKTLAQSSGKMIDAVLDGYSNLLDRIVKDNNLGANRKVRRGPQTPLSADQLASLNQMKADCERVPGAVDALTRAFAVPLAMKTADNTSHANRIVDRINGMLAENERVEDAPVAAKRKRKTG